MVSAVDLQRLGLTRSQVSRATRRGVLVRRGRGVYALPEVAPEPDLHGRAKTLRGTISHCTAALWWGLEMAHSPTRQHLTVSRNRGRRADAVRGWRLHRANLPADALTVHKGLPVTTPLRTVLDCARRLPLAPAVVIADSALRKRLITIDELVAASAQLPPGPLRGRVRLVVSLADPRSGSVLESLTRVLLWENGLAPTESQYSFRDSRGLWVGYFDFAWPAFRLVLEADGFEFHSSRADLRKDCRRHNALTQRGWWLLRVTWEDVVFDPGSVIAMVRDALAALAPLVA
jgi:very-short-patch-repair endonuclease